MKGVMMFIFLFIMAANKLFASDKVQLQNTLDEISILRQDIQKVSASFLVLAKQLENPPESAQETANVIKANVSVMDSDLATANRIRHLMPGEQLTVLGSQGEWHRVRLHDQRVGWVHDNDVRFRRLQTDGDGGRSVMNSDDRARIRQAVERLYVQVMEQAESADVLIAEFEKQFNSFSASEKQQADSLIIRLSAEKEKIDLSRVYVNHYYQKLEPIHTAPAARAGSTPVGFDGTLSTRIGSSAFESGTNISETTRNINLAGNIMFNPRSRATVNISHNNDVVQTAYTNSQIHLGYLHNTEAGTRLRGTFNFQNYGDNNISRNNFNDVGAGLNAEHPISAAARIFGDIQVQSKRFTEPGNNDFTGAGFNAGVENRGSRTRLNAGIRGRMQSSDISFLDYSRIIPNLKLTYFTNKGSFSIAGEGEQLTYAQGAQSNDFNRGRVDFEWAEGGKSTVLSATVKQFPNNETLDNVRLRLQNQKNNTSAGVFGRRSVYMQYIFHTQENSMLINYFDIRYDRNQSTGRNYFDLSIYSRIWEETGRDHILDIYSRFGVSLPHIQIGPVVGVQLLVNTDDFEFERSGNSVRGGVDARVNTIIKKAIVHGNIRVQRTILFSGSADIDNRIPTTIEVSAGAKMPIIDVLDLHIDLNYYNIDLDLPEAPGTGFQGKQSGLRFLAGIQYRFDRQQFGR
jgi:hypothetical protein